LVSGKSVDHLPPGFRGKYSVGLSLELTDCEIPVGLFGRH
jgi:hypothetical protein